MTGYEIPHDLSRCQAQACFVCALGSDKYAGSFGMLINAFFQPVVQSGVCFVRGCHADHLCPVNFVVSLSHELHQRLSSYSEPNFQDEIGGFYLATCVPCKTGVHTAGVY